MSNLNKPAAVRGTPTTSQAKTTAGDLADKAKDTAEGAMESAASQVRAQAGAAKSSVADEVSGISSALRKAAEDMRQGSPQERTFSQIAEGLADASEAMQNKDLGTMVADLGNFARKNPLVFLGGAALVGFVATRFAVASQESPTQKDSVMSHGESATTREGLKTRGSLS